MQVPSQRQAHKFHEEAQGPEFSFPLLVGHRTVHAESLLMPPARQVPSHSLTYPLDDGLSLLLGRLA
jgi:hypothetical protein